jgi:transcriptional regulator with XRE-family HTH domain
MEALQFGNIVRNARLAAGLSQEDLGRAAGIPQSHVAKIEAGADVRSSTLARVLGSLGCRVEIRREEPSELFLAPPRGSRIAAAQHYGVDLGQLYAGFSMSPAERLEAAARSANGLAELFR